jgi:hypothetical protein
VSWRAAVGGALGVLGGLLEEDVAGAAREGGREGVNDEGVSDPATTEQSRTKQSRRDHKRVGE